MGRPSVQGEIGDHPFETVGIEPAHGCPLVMMLDGDAAELLLHTCHPDRPLRSVSVGDSRGLHTARSNIETPPDGLCVFNHLTAISALSGRRWRIGFPRRWPPSAAQTVHAVFPHTAFTKTHASGTQSKVLTEPGLPARTHRTACFQEVVSNPCYASAYSGATGYDAVSSR